MCYLTNANLSLFSLHHSQIFFSGRSKGGREGRPPGVQILSISCSFWENLAKSYVGAKWGVGTPPQGNPGSATLFTARKQSCEKVHVMFYCFHRRLFVHGGGGVGNIKFIMGEGRWTPHLPSSDIRPWDPLPTSDICW